LLANDSQLQTKETTMLNHELNPLAAARRPRVAALLSGAALLAGAAPLAAAVALTPAPLGAAVPAAASSSVRHASAPLNAGTQSHTTVPFSALGAVKYPLDGGD
jgi:hypothetical protein